MILRTFEVIPSLFAQFLVLLPTDLVHGPGDILHNMKAIKADLLDGSRDTFQTGMDVRRPHIHADALNLPQLLWRKLIVPILQCLFCPTLADVNDRTRAGIRHNRHIVLPLPGRNFIHTNLIRKSFLSSLKSSRYRTLHNPINHRPTHLQVTGDRRHRLHLQQ